MQYISKSSLVLCFALGLLALYAYSENSKTQKQLKLMCQALSGDYSRGECLSMTKSAPAESGKIERCPEGQFVIAVHPDRSIECGTLAKLNPSLIRVDQDPGKATSSEIGGWRVVDVCPMDKSANHGACRDLQQGLIPQCSSDVLPTHFAMNSLRVSIPVPCQERGTRCQFSDDMMQPQSIRTVLKCDDYKILKFSIGQ